MSLRAFCAKQSPIIWEYLSRNCSLLIRACFVVALGFDTPRQTRDYSTGGATPRNDIIYPYPRYSTIVASP